MHRLASRILIALALLCVVSSLPAQDSPAPAQQKRPSRTATMVPVAEGVQVEVLDWGGTGRPLVLLTGLGNQARIFDKFASDLIAQYHVYGISRRGSGNSSAPQPDATNYTAARLGQDVIAVVDALHLNKPVIAGHSIAGEELSYIAVHHPEKVAGLVYLDAGYPYALYDEKNGSLDFDAAELRDQLAQLAGPLPGDPLKFLDDLKASLQRVKKEVAQERQDIEGLQSQPAGEGPSPRDSAILNGRERFTTFQVPALVIFADPHDLGSEFKDDPKAQAALRTMDHRDTERQAVAFERQVPSAHVVRIPGADHYVFRSNEADILREMNAFINTLPQN